MKKAPMNPPCLPYPAILAWSSTRLGTHSGQATGGSGLTRGRASQNTFPTFRLGTRRHKPLGFQFNLGNRFSIPKPLN
ncbi:MAG: hypothetical protein KME54_01015 [Tolypothrix brevis GSE-NOS-MK-07-07A]|nr:hypothetical protein [Tolypothrix brevis GSE-NOS-MK-07-07A]